MHWSVLVKFTTNLSMKHILLMLMKTSETTCTGKQSNLFSALQQQMTMTS